MNPLLAPLTRLGFVLGFSLPYLHLAWIGQYPAFLLFLVGSILRLDGASVFVVLGFLLVVIQALRGRWIAAKTYEVLFFSLIMILMVVPSLAVPILVFLAPSWVTASIGLYFSGLATTVTVAPLLVFFYQMEVIAQSKGGVMAPAFLTLSNYVLIALLSLSLLIEGLPAPTDVASLGTRILTRVVMSLSSMAASLSGLSAATPGAALGAGSFGRDHLLLLGAFTVCTALYFYHRLTTSLRTDASSERELTELVRKRITLRLVGATLLAGIALSFLLILLAQALLPGPQSLSLTLTLAVAVALLTLYRAERKVRARWNT